MSPTETFAEFVLSFFGFTIPEYPEEADFEIIYSYLTFLAEALLNNFKATRLLSGTVSEFGQLRNVLFGLKIGGRVCSEDSNCLKFLSFLKSCARNTSDWPPQPRSFRSL